MFKGLGNIANLMNQAKNIGGQMEEVTNELKSKQVVGEAGGRMVEVIANGLGQVIKINVDPILKDKQDLEMVLDLLPAAINDASEKAKALHVEAMQSLTGGFDLPAGLGDTLKNMLGQPDATPDSDKPVS